MLDVFIAFLLLFPWGWDAFCWLCSFSGLDEKQNLR